MVKEENKKATDEAIDSYKRSMRESLSDLPHETQDLLEFHMVSEKKAFTLFGDKAWCSLNENFNGDLLKNLQVINTNVYV